MLWDIDDCDHHHHDFDRQEYSRLQKESFLYKTGVSGEKDRAEKRNAYQDAQINKLNLICQAMWELIRDNTRLTEDDLLKKVKEIDLRDGVEDGKITPDQNCRKCNRRLQKRQARCLYCGEEIKQDGVFL